MVIERYNEEIVVEVVAVSDMYESETGIKRFSENMKAVRNRGLMKRAGP